MVEFGILESGETFYFQGQQYQKIRDETAKDSVSGEIVEFFDNDEVTQ